MDDNADDEILHEVEITFAPRAEVLEELGITLDAFEAALVLALEDREEAAEEEGTEEFEAPPLEEMMLDINGATYRLEDLAEVEIKEGDTPADL